MILLYILLHDSAIQLYQKVVILLCHVSFSCFTYSTFHVPVNAFPFLVKRSISFNVLFSVCFCLCLVHAPVLCHIKGSLGQLMASDASWPHPGCLGSGRDIRCSEWCYPVVHTLCGKRETVESSRVNKEGLKN